MGRRWLKESLSSPPGHDLTSKESLRQGKDMKDRDERFSCLPLLAVTFLSPTKVFRIRRIIELCYIYIIDYIGI